MKRPAHFTERKRFSSIVYLFHEGRTELRYLQDICADATVQIKKQEENAAPLKLLESAVRFVCNAHKMILKTTPDPHVWVVFDDDEKPDIRVAAEWLEQNHSRIPASFTERFHVGFMKPCIELWGMLCLPQGKSTFRRAKTHETMQRELHRIMPKYDHDKNPYFDSSKMTEWGFACSKAMDWENTSGQFPSCINTSFFAGIHGLVKRIMEAR